MTRVGQSVLCFADSELLTASYTSRVSCQKGPTRHAYAWQIGPFGDYQITSYWAQAFDIVYNTFFIYKGVLTSALIELYQQMHTVANRYVSIYSLRYWVFYKSLLIVIYSSVGD